MGPRHSSLPLAAKAATTATRPLTMPAPTRRAGRNGRLGLRAATEFRTLSIQVGEEERSTRRLQSARPFMHPRWWRELLNELVPFRSALRLREAEGRQREAALLQVAESLRGLRHHLCSIDELLVQQGTSSTLGLEAQAVARRAAKHGRNVPSPTLRLMPLRVLSWFYSGFNRFNWASVVVFFLCWKPIGNPPQSGNMAMAIVVILVICLQAMFAAWQEWMTSRTMHEITDMLPAETTVIRDGTKATVLSADLVPGDLVSLYAGDRVPADLRLINVSVDVLVDRSALSGTTDPTIGTTAYTDTNYLETRNMAMMGASITQGHCKGIVVSTGDRTVLGRINKLVVSKPPEHTILQYEVRRLVNALTTVSLAIGTLFIVLWAVWLRKSHPGFLSASDALANGVGVLVTFVPGGLPISFTLALTAIAKRMQRHSVLIKNLATIETLGIVNVICCEKTGTLTQRRIAVTRVGFADRETTLDALVEEQAPAGIDELAPAARRLYETAALCCDAEFEAMSMHLPVDERAALGDATDCAILRMAEHICPLRHARMLYTTLLTIPFSLRRRWMLTVCKPENSHPFILIKGAPETLLPHCTSIQSSTGDIVPLDEAMRDRIDDTQRRWANEGCRVLLLCQRRFPDDSVTDNPLIGIEYSTSALYNVASKCIELLCVVGLVGMVDPVRHGIPSAIDTFRGAGIRVFMVTGDYAPTAAFVARQCKIITSKEVAGIDEVKARAAQQPAEILASATLPSAQPTNDMAIDTESDETRNMHQPLAVDSQLSEKHESQLDSREQQSARRSLVVSGPELAALRTRDWDVIARYEEIVFARIMPEQKLQVVEEMRARGSIVAVTGDDVNDLPAMLAADVGIAMGNGSEVAKDAAEIVLLTSNFSSLVTAIESGRMIFINMKKVIVYLLPMTNMSEIVPSLLNVVLGLPIPLSTFLMLVINVITDVWASVLLANEEPEADILQRPPRDPKKEGLVNVRLFVHAYLFIGLMETLAGHIMFFLCIYLRGGIGPQHVFLAFDKWTDGYMGKSKQELSAIVNMSGSAHFMGLVIMQWGNMFAARTRRLSVVQQNPLWGPKRNPLLLVAIPISVAVALFFSEIDWFNRIFLTGKIPVEFFFLPLPFALALLAAEELRKLLVRRYPQSLVARMAW
ncbi:hypothetical protein LPJ61_001158 [Coemansia biformis]|uniref:Cation-transporting P-type ATPase N-terminal domain-containing protein n=1 Tax=Coemansia biformis TaxID=1286918 RepID=A0A9W8CYD7_9FUNG|nr:hypothetical protein LPJ61_001158 [Coemansia biformis]